MFQVKNKDKNSVSWRRSDVFIFNFEHIKQSI